MFGFMKEANKHIDRDEGKMSIITCVPMLHARTITSTFSLRFLCLLFHLQTHVSLFSTAVTVL